jgi:CubicO group peptidase (beta-lactamase class C family)
MEVSASRAGFSAERIERITAHLNENYLDSGKIAGCQVLVARRGQLAYYKSLGSMDRERGKPMREDTIFRIYSMTKPITAVALMQLYERGLFQLNDPVHRVIPEWRSLREYVGGEAVRMETRPVQKPITFRHLLTHTAGLTYGGGPIAEANLHPVDRVYRELNIATTSSDSLQDFVKKLARAPLRYTPGERWMYSFASERTRR